MPGVYVCSPVYTGENVPSSDTACGSQNQTLHSELSREERALYSRHILLPQVGYNGQKKLKNARVLLIGAGGLGSPCALYLAAAGVGTLGIVDDDNVERSNLQRQILHSMKSLGKSKVASAKERLEELNPLINIAAFPYRLSSGNALELFREYDVIVDGTDNFPSRYLINDACVLLGKPLVYGAVFQNEGYITVFDSTKGCCLRCLFSKPPDPKNAPSCGDAGILGTVTGVIGSLQATEVIKLIVGTGKPLVNRLLRVDFWEMRLREFTLTKDPACSLCGAAATIHELVDYEWFCGNQKDEAENADATAEISPYDLKRRLDAGDNIRVIDIRLPDELSFGHIPGALAISVPELLSRTEELDSDCDTVLVCKKGEKSKAVIMALYAEGYRGPLFNLSGGMNAWAKDVAPAMIIY